MVECPDRRLVRAVTELADDMAADGQTEVLLVLPRRAYRGLASRVLHDHTADRIVAAVTQIPNVSATIAPFNVSGLLHQRAETLARTLERPDRPVRAKLVDVPAAVTDAPLDVAVEGITPLGQVAHRQRVRVAGRVRTVSVQSWAGVPTFECTIVDRSGALTVVFLGRRDVAGIEPGTQLAAEGMVGSHRGRLAMLNPGYQLLMPSPSAKRGSVAS